MADLRIIDIGTTTTTTASDDYLAIDGVTNGTRKILWDSLEPSHTIGSLYVTSTAATSPSDTTSYFKVAGTTTLNTTESVVVGLDMPANNRLRYTGTPKIHAQITASLSITTASNNQVISFRVYKYDASATSGATLVHSEIQSKTTTGSDVEAVTLHADCLLETNDYIEIHVRNITSASDITVEKLNLVVQGLRDLS